MSSDGPSHAGSAGTTPSMLDRLALSNIANCDVFTGHGIPTYWGRLYGGQAVAQSLMAAQATLPNADLSVHSLHGYFILAGNPAIPILYDVERVRDGASFATRMVKALQANRTIFTMLVSFHRDERGPSYQVPVREIRAMLPGSQRKGGGGAPAWRAGHETPTPEMLLRAGVEMEQHNGSSWLSILPVAEGDRWTLKWFRYEHRDAATPLTRAQEAAVLAYLSDMQCVRTVKQPHVRKAGVTGLPGDDVFSMCISLDHSIFFHRRVDPTRWLLCFCETSTSSGARGLATTTVFQEPGVLVATITQEAMVRVPRDWSEEEEEVVVEEEDAVGGEGAAKSKL